MKKIIIIFLIAFGVQKVQAQSTDANLSGLSISSGTLSPSFLSTVTSYSVSALSNVTSSVTITPTAADVSATIAVQINGDGYTNVSSGTASSNLPLYIGSNFIEVRVTAQDNSTTKIYSFDLFRLPNNALVSLSSMLISSGSLSPVINIPTQNSPNISKAVVVNSVISVVAVAANVNSATVSLEYKWNGGVYVSLPNKVYSIEYELNLGINVLEVRVSDFGLVRNYRILITRVNADLDTMSINSGTLVPAFLKANTTYTVDLKNFDTNGVFGILPTLSNPNATLKRSINGSAYIPISNGVVSTTSLNKGVNTINISVIDEGGLTNKIYTIRAITGQQGVGINGENTMINSGYDSSGKLTNIGYVNSSGKIINDYNGHFANCDGSSPTVVVEVTSITGKVWMDRDLGAQRAAISATDNFSYGCLYQWGRGNDGHASVIYTSSTSGIAANGLTTNPSITDTPGHNLFIWAAIVTADWRTLGNDMMWQGVNGINNPCPTGFRVPTQTELSAEFTAYDIRTSAAYFSTPLRFNTMFDRVGKTTSFVKGSGTAFYWTSTVNGSDAYGYSRSELNQKLSLGIFSRSNGLAVRCIKD
jgi:uncharacterized protein (TIGR02145 family)